MRIIAAITHAWPTKHDATLHPVRGATAVNVVDIEI